LKLPSSYQPYRIVREKNIDINELIKNNPPTYKSPRGVVTTPTETAQFSCTMPHLTGDTILGYNRLPPLFVDITGHGDFHKQPCSMIILTEPVSATKKRYHCQWRLDESNTLLQPDHSANDILLKLAGFKRVKPSVKKTAPSVTSSSAQASPTAPVKTGSLHDQVVKRQMMKQQETAESSPAVQKKLTVSSDPGGFEAALRQLPRGKLNSMRQAMTNFFIKHKMIKPSCSDVIVINDSPPGSPQGNVCHFFVDQFDTDSGDEVQITGYSQIPAGSKPTPSSAGRSLPKSQQKKRKLSTEETSDQPKAKKTTADPKAAGNQPAPKRQGEQEMELTGEEMPSFHDTSAQTLAAKQTQTIEYFMIMNELKPDMPFEGHFQPKRQQTRKADVTPVIYSKEEYARITELVNEYNSNPENRDKQLVMRTRVQVLPFYKHNWTIWECDYCPSNKEFPSQAAMLAHYNREHRAQRGGEKKSCPLCLTDTDKRNSKIHVESHYPFALPGNNNYLCITCMLDIPGRLVFFREESTYLDHLGDGVEGNVKKKKKEQGHTLPFFFCPYCDQLKEGVSARRSCIDRCEINQIRAICQLCPNFTASVPHIEGLAEKWSHFLRHHPDQLHRMWRQHPKPDKKLVFSEDKKSLLCPYCQEKAVPAPLKSEGGVSLKVKGQMLRHVIEDHCPTVGENKYINEFIQDYVALAGVDDDEIAELLADALENAPE
jgi:hypothetical protein